MNERTPPVKATATSFRIIEALQANSGAGVSELSREVNLSKSAVYKHVQTLVQLGYLVRVDNEYYLSLRFLNLGTHARERIPLSVARPAVTDLAETTGHTTSFIAREGERGVYALVESEGDTETEIAEGNVVPLHATGGGKAILAFLDDETRNRIIENTTLSQHTEKTITERPRLEEELRSVRDQRVAFGREECITGRQSVASPIIGTDKEAIGAISVAGPLKHMSGKRLEEDVAGLVTSTAKRIAKKLLSS